MFTEAILVQLEKINCILEITLEKLVFLILHRNKKDLQFEINLFFLIAEIYFSVLTSHLISI